MPGERMIKSLAKVMIAAAWADGAITHDEVNSLKDLLFHLPGMTARDWAEIEIYVDSPVEEAERQRLLADLQADLGSSSDKTLALQALDTMVQAGGGLSEADRAGVEQIKTSIHDAQLGPSRAWNKFMRGRVSDRLRSIQETPNRELFMDDFVRNKIYYSVSRRLSSDRVQTEISDADLRKLSLAGGLLARVAYVDRQVSEAEFQSIQQALETYWGIPASHAALVAEVAVSEIAKGLDHYRLTRQFFEITTETERVRFLDALFAVTASDGRAADVEMEEIRAISNGLLLTHKQFIDAKLKIPRELRAN